jgi:hypothetical protein
MPGMERPGWQGRALLATCLLMLGGATALGGCGGSTQTTTVTTTVKAHPRHRPAHNVVPSANGTPAGQRVFEIRHFRRDAPKELRSVAACFGDAGFGTPSLHSHDLYSGTGPYASAEVKTAIGSYEAAIFPKSKDAYVWAFQQTSAPGAGSYAVHASYYGRVALYSEAFNRTGGIAERGDESHAYYAERTAVAACAFSIPAARGHPALVY